MIIALLKNGFIIFNKIYYANHFLYYTLIPQHFDLTLFISS